MRFRAAMVLSASTENAVELPVHRRWTAVYGKANRSTKDYFGRCLGLGDSFLVAITAVPAYAAGFIHLKDGNAALTGNLSTQFSYGVILDAKKRLAEQQDKASYRRDWRRAGADDGFRTGRQVEGQRCRRPALY